MTINDFFQLTLCQMKEYVDQVIQSGFCDENGAVYVCTQLPAYFRETDVFVQTPEQLLESKVGWSWDRAELVRAYFVHHNIEHAVLYEEYLDVDTKAFFANSFVVYRDQDKFYQEFADSSVSFQHPQERQIIKRAYNRFIESVRSVLTNFDYGKLFLGRYERPMEVFQKNKSLSQKVRQTTLFHHTEEVVYETSCMAVVSCRYLDDIKVLTIENDNNQIDFPKGHPENGETQLETAIRECWEETRVKLSESDFFRELTGYGYQFNAGILRMENDDFYQYFKAKIVIKSIKVFSFVVREMQEPVPLSEERLIHSHWYSMDELDDVLSYENAKELVRELRSLLQ